MAKVPKMTFVNDRSTLPSKAVLRNLTGGVPWQAEFFEFDTSSASFKFLPKRTAAENRPIGFGSRVIGISGGRPLGTFLALYFLRVNGDFSTGEMSWF